MSSSLMPAAIIVLIYSTLFMCRVVSGTSHDDIRPTISCETASAPEVGSNTFSRGGPCHHRRS